MKTKKKTCILLVTVCLLIGCAIGGTLAWLTAKTGEVKNTFTTSDINVDLTETKEDFKMVPDWTIDKDPVVTVKAGSEDCWLFVEVTESTNPKLADYIAYQVDLADPETEKDGWTKGTGDTGNGVPTSVYFRKVTDVGTTGDGKSFKVLGAGTKEVESVTYSWNEDQVLVLPTVTKGMMEALNKDGAVKPTLTFEAYAVQLWKTNKPVESATDEQKTAAQFTAAEAWTQAQALKNSQSGEN